MAIQAIYNFNPIVAGTTWTDQPIFNIPSKDLTGATINCTFLDSKYNLSTGSGITILDEHRFIFDVQDLSLPVGVHPYDIDILFNTDPIIKKTYISGIFQIIKNIL